MYEYVTEIVIHRADDVALAAATIARAGAIPMLEDARVNARRWLGDRTP